jgi:CRISPR-associated protein Csd1
MILQSLTRYYEALASRGEISRLGWGPVKISFALELNANGTLSRVVPLASVPEGGKKPVPRILNLPAPIKRTAGVAPNFLWDTSSYLLGMDGKGKPERTKQCFQEAKELHLRLLSGLDDPFARAICRYFSSWNPDAAADSPLLADYKSDIEKGGNLVFLFEGRLPGECAALCQAWQNHYDQDAEGEKMRCLVTGERAVPDKVHPAIKNVQGAQSSGAALVSFNGEAFCSYDRKQDLNAPVGKYAAFAYTTALNTLLADREHVRRFGDTTVVFWAESAEQVYQDVFCAMLDGGEELTNAELTSCMDDLAHGQPTNWEALPLRPENRFYILGLAPNASRLSVRFFLQGNFGDFAANGKRHYEDIRVVSDGRSKWDAIPLWALLRETVNLNARNKDALPQMAGDVLRAILSGGPYPATLYQQTQIRIRAERAVTRGRAGILKAYLTRLPNNEKYREALTVELNEKTTYQPYVLGRLFSVLEGIQQAANPGINTTITDKYFTSACATPAVVFPTLLNLAKKHLKKMGGGKQVYWDKQLTQLIGMITESYPAHHSLYDEGIFQLGYYHQTQKRYEKKDKTDAEEPAKEEKNNG